MGADVLAPCVAKASATKIFTMLYQNNSVTTCLGLTHYVLDYFEET